MAHMITGVADPYKFVKETLLFTGMSPSKVQAQIEISRIATILWTRISSESRHLEDRVL